MHETQPLGEGVGLAGQHRGKALQRRRQLQPHPVAIAQRRLEVGGEGGPLVEGGEPLAAGALPHHLAGTDREQRRLLPQLLRRLLVHVALDARHVVGAAREVDLVHDEHDVLAPAEDEPEEVVLARRVRAQQRGDEEDEVGPRHEPLGQQLLLALHRVGAGGVDDVQVLQQLDRQLVDEQARLGLAHRLDGPVAQQVHRPRRRQLADLEGVGPEDGVQERRLAGVELADDHDEEQLVEATPHRLEGLEVARHHVEVGEQLAAGVEQRPLLVHQLAFLGGQERVHAGTALAWRPAVDAPAAFERRWTPPLPVQRGAPPRAAGTRTAAPRGAGGAAHGER